MVNGRYVKSIFSSVSGGHLSFTVADGLIGFQYDKPPGEREARTLIFDQHEMVVFIAGVKNGEFDHLYD